jgi:hypothetical protein
MAPHQGCWSGFEEADLAQHPVKQLELRGPERQASDAI